MINAKLDDQVLSIFYQGDATGTYFLLLYANLLDLTKQSSKNNQRGEKSVPVIFLFVNRVPIPWPNSV